MTVITSRQHPIVKEFRDLARGGGPSILLDGWHLFVDAVNVGLVIETAAICGSPTADARLALETARRGGARVLEVSEAVLNALSPVNSPTGVVAAAARPQVDVMSVLRPAPALVLVGVGVQDPGNTGALVRSAAAAGSTGVVVDDTTADPWGWKALRASMGSAFRVPVVRTKALASLVDGWRAAGVTVVAAVPRDGTPMSDVDFTGPTAILLGGEGAGLPDAVMSTADIRVTIPMSEAVESLNVAVAAAVLLYEARRQRASGTPWLAR